MKATGLNTGQDTVTTSGTAEALNGGASITVPNEYKIAIRALYGNDGIVYVGDSNVTTSNGAELDPGDPINLHQDDVSNVFIDADNDGDGVSWAVEDA